MAYMSQETKARIASRVKPLLKQYGIKGTLSVRHHSTIVLNISAGQLDFIGNYNATLDAQDYCTDREYRPTSYMDVNPYSYRRSFSGEVLEFVTQLFDALNLRGEAGENFDKSEPQSDYFFVGWYVDVNVGKYNRPYQLTTDQKAAA